MKRTITVILAIALMAIPVNAIAHIETWSEYDQRLEKQIAEMQDKLPIVSKEEGDIPFEMRITSVEKNGDIITTTMETKGEFGWLKMAEVIGGVEKFKMQQQRYWVRESLNVSGLQIARHYTLRYIYVDNGKEICIVDVNKFIIMSITDFVDIDNLEYVPTPLDVEEYRKFIDYEKYLKEGGYSPAGLTPEQIHKFREFSKYKKF